MADGRDGPHATFVRPDLGSFCRLDELGLQVVGQWIEPGRAVLACRVVETDEFARWCRRCGCEAAPHDSVTRRLADEPLGWRPTTLLITSAAIAAPAVGMCGAIIEQVYADVTSGPLAHMPSGVFAANAAWLSIAAMAHNLIRAAGVLASLPFAKARAATIRWDLIAVAARTARHGRGHSPCTCPKAGTASTNG